VSYHEVGHALISAVQKNSEPVQKITIVPRTMGALGYVMQVPEEEKYLNTKAELHDMIVGLLGGRAAEELKFETVTTGASNDIERATAIARNMVTQYGMSSKFGLMGLATVESQYLEGRAVLNCSDVTAAAVDEEVRLIMEECYNEAKAILSENMEAMDMIADYLIREETITGKEFMELYRQAKGIPEPEEGEGSAETAIEAERKEIAKIEAMPASIPEIKAEAEARAEEAAEAIRAEAVSETAEAEAAPETAAPKTEAPKAAVPEADDEEEAEEKPVKNGPRGRFTDVPQEDVDRFFKK
jgi:cell division protease FtsH